jgi:hypothetical protein
MARGRTLWLLLRAGIMCAGHCRCEQSRLISMNAGTIHLAASSIPYFK